MYLAKLPIAVSSILLGDQIRRIKSKIGVIYFNLG